MDPLPPKPRQTLKGKSQDAIEAQSEKQKTIARCFDRLAKTKDGLFALQTIFEMSGHNTSPLILTAQVDVSSNMMLVKQGRAGLWLDLRKFFSRESLIAIEYPETKGN